MPTYKSKAGIAVQAHVVTAQEGQLRVQVGGGMDTLGVGDALIKGEAENYVLRAELFAALFEADDGDDQEQPKQGRPPKQSAKADDLPEPAQSQHVQAPEL